MNGFELFSLKVFVVETKFVAYHIEYVFVNTTFLLHNIIVPYAYRVYRNY